MKSALSLILFFCFFGIPIYAKVVIEKSPNDTRIYEYLELPNKLRAVVVSDKSAEKSAATLSVLAGSFDEPADKPGLAHFLEHMIIMGSKKYPHPGSFNTYVSDHGGNRNAMTAQDRTTFFYDINPPYFEESLARFSDHFVHPLFDKNYIEKEIKAVDSEFQMHQEDDFYRGYYVLKNIVNPHHPMHRFTAGNAQSLWPINKEKGSTELRKRFMAFYDEFYSADKMVLVLVGPQSTHELANWAKKYFSEIPFVPQKPELTIPADVKNTILAFREGIETQKNIVIHPKKPFYSISLAFPIPSQKKNYQTQPLMYLDVLFANRAEGGLIHQLKQKGWILGMMPNRYEISDREELYALNFSLTEAGLSHVDEIIQACYNYIDEIKKSNLPDWLYDEIKKSDQINFQFVENVPSSSLSNYLAKNLHDYPPEKILSYAYLKADAAMPKKAIASLLNQFTHKKMILFAFMPGQKQNKTEPYYNVPYYQESFTAEQLNFWKRPEGILTKPIILSKKNEFLPSDFAIKPLPKYAQPKLIDAAFNRYIWYMPESEFNMPKIETRIALHTPYIYESPKNLLLGKLLLGLVSEEMGKVSIELALAGAGINYGVLETGLGISISGYSDLTVYDKIAEKSILALRNYSVDTARFAIQKEALLKSYHATLLANPIENYKQEIGSLLLKRKVSTSTLIEALEKIQPKDLKAFQHDFFKNITLEILVVGNLRKYEAKNLAQKVISLLNLPPHSTRNEKKYQAVSLSPILSLPTGGQLLTLSHEHPDNLVALYLQMKGKKVNTLAKTYLTDYLIKTKFFDALRTEAQFGYIVFSQSMVIRDLPGLMFLIQSPQYDHGVIYKQMNQFFTSYQKILKEIPLIDFEQAKRSLVADILEKPKTLAGKTQFHWSEIVDRTYRFNRSEELAKAVNKISQKDLSNFYADELLNIKRKELTAFGMSSQKLINQQKVDIKNLRIIKDKILFKEKSEYIP